MKSFDFSSFFAQTLLFFLFFISLLAGQLLEAQALSTNPNDIYSDSNNLAADQDNSIRKFKPWLEEDNATGNWFGLRDRLSQKGIDLGFSYINEVWGNTTGGIKTGSVYTSVLQFATAVNLEKLMNWRGASFYSRWLYLGGQDPSSYLVGDILGVSNIGAYNTFRNIELWLQQNIFEDKISLRAGQLVADSEFVISDYGALFINNTLGWPAFIFTSIPNGGPAFPIGAPGVRLKLKPNDQFSLKAALFQGNVYPQNINNHGFDWNLNSNQGYFYLTEAAANYELHLPGEIKMGAWFSSSTFPNFSNQNASFSGNYGLYGIIDQMIYRPCDKNNSKAPSSSDDKKVAGKKNDKGLGVFHRIAFEPADRNVLQFYCDSGFNYKGLIPTRDQDLIGLAFAYGALSNDGIKNITQQGLGSGPANTTYDIELTYQAQLSPWLSVQPDLQYVIHPGINQIYPNAVVVGLRVSVTF